MKGVGNFGIVRPVIWTNLANNLWHEDFRLGVRSHFGAPD